MNSLFCTLAHSHTRWICLLLEREHEHILLQSYIPAYVKQPGNINAWVRKPAARIPIRYISYRTSTNKKVCYISQSRYFIQAPVNEILPKITTKIKFWHIQWNPNRNQTWNGQCNVSLGNTGKLAAPAAHGRQLSIPRHIHRPVFVCNFRSCIPVDAMFSAVCVLFVNAIGTNPHQRSLTRL